MKFRTSFERSPEDDAVRLNMPTIPFKMPTMRPKQSKAAVTCNEQSDEVGKTQQTRYRVKAMQDFLRATGTNLKATGANIRATSAKLPARMKPKSDRVVKNAPPSKRDSELRSLDIDDEVLDRLMGLPKDKTRIQKQSDSFLLKQRIRVSSRAAASPGMSPLSGMSQAEQDRKLLSTEEVQASFIGAPFFNVQKIGEERFRPQVTFRSGEAETVTCYGTDYATLGHSSFAASTMGLHRRKEMDERTSSRTHRTFPTYKGDNLVETPSQLSANGLDPGTIGFEHFLQLPISDAALLPDEPTVFEKRKLLHSEPAKLGLRHLNLESLIDRLNELGTLHNALQSDGEAQEPWNQQKASEMGEDLFAKLLDPELGTMRAGTGSVALIAQIVALQEVLNKTEIWHDFSQVEWRLRVGQLLWASPEQEMPQLDENRQPSERDVLLLQITLAAELLLRLSALVACNYSLEDEDRASVEKLQTKKLIWDLLLTERFLENLKITTRVPQSPVDKRNSLFSIISFSTAYETTDEAKQAVQPLLFPRNETQQLSGLLYFAEAIQWPHTEVVRRELEAKLRPPVPRQQNGPAAQDKKTRPVSGMSQYATPLSSLRLPGGYTPSANRNSYFSELAKQRPSLSRMTTAQSMQLLPSALSEGGAGADAFEVGGWLSRSWLTGLILPGESANHFLISTLLENSPQAIEVLGDSANLYGGFVYEGRTFCSKSCVVGRVMAATKGAKDCMGWISVPSAPYNGDKGWIDMEIKDVPMSTTKPRIRDGDVVANSSDPLHGTLMTDVQAVEISTPTDGPPVMGNEVTCHGFSFTASQASSELTKAAEGAALGAKSANIAHVTFSSPINTILVPLSVPLTYDVHFIASYPCHPEPAIRPRASSKPPAPASSQTAHNSGVRPSADERGSNTVSPDSNPVEAFKSNRNESKLKDNRDAQSSRLSLQQQQQQEEPCDSAHTSSIITLSLRDAEKELPLPPAHPLHINYHFDIIPVASLLSLAPENRPRALSSPKDPGKAQVKSDADDDEGVIVLDCRGAEDLELLGRSWCAKVGEHAIIGRSGRTCLACCIREARALGVSVVIRT